MPTLTAEAQLAAAFNIEAVTGFRFYQDGILDDQTGTIKALGSSRWSDLTNWRAYKDWISIRRPIKWTAPLLDIGSVRYFTINVNTEFQGTPSHFDIAVSETGEFAGEETLYKILEGNTNVSAFYGRYVYVSFTVNGTELSRMTVSTSTQTSEITFTNINTSTLSGTAAARQLPITNPISQVVSMDIRVVATTAYNMDVYVTDAPTSTALVPVVVSKSGTTPTFRLVGLDNQARNGIVDISIQALPRQAVVGGNLLVIR
jgi:hypothetical protein